MTMTDDARPDILLIMTDQQRFDTIRCLGNDLIRTPNLDRLVARSTTFGNAYSTCPVCVPARYTIRTGCEPTRTDIWDNTVPNGRHAAIADEIGPYLGETMSGLGYRTFGVGKFHTTPWDAPVGLETQLHSEELYHTPEQRAGDAYAAWIAAEHPEHDWVDALMGERTEMYYMPQMSAMPADCTVESWAADRTVELIETDDPRPYFGHVSFIGPHPPFAPPAPFHRMYDPDRMPLPVLGDLAVDHLDQHLPWMNHAVFAEDVDGARARSLKARYYAEITYIDGCLGRILDAVDRRPDPDNVMIIFVSDHGDLLGDHHGWQKESFFEAATRIPFLVGWPRRLPQGGTRDDLVALTDLFGTITSAAGTPELRQGHDVLGGLLGTTAPRDHLFGFHGRPGTERFKAMVRQGSDKLIWMANGGRRLLFDLATDPDELGPQQDDRPERADQLQALLVDELRDRGVDAAFDGADLRTEPYRTWPLGRIYQFDRSRGVMGFPDDPAEVVDTAPA